MPLQSPPPAVILNIADIEISKPDSAGRFTVAYAPGPFVLYAPSVTPLDGLPSPPLGKRAFTYVVPVPYGCITSVRTFLGWDAGSIGEATIELIAGSFRLYERSEHKETAGNYDAWRERAVHFEPPDRAIRVGRHNITFVVSAEMLAPRTVDGGLSTRAEAAFRLTIDRNCGDDN